MPKIVACVGDIVVVENRRQLVASIAGEAGTLRCTGPLGVRVLSLFDLRWDDEQQVFYHA